MTLGPGAARLLLVPILLAYGYVAVGYARATPRWNNPDEPAHVNVVRQVARTGTLPVLSPGDWDKPLLDRLTTHWFPNDYEVAGLRYEGHQPPLYYLLAAPVHRLTDHLSLRHQIIALRLVSVTLGALTVLAAFVAAREAAPDRPVLAVLTAATVAFIPMHTAISAAVNNDALANALAAVTLAALMVGRRRGFSDRWAVGLGLLIGALVLTKLTVYVYVPLILATLWLAGRDSTLRPSAGDAPHPPPPSPARGRGGARTDIAPLTIAMTRGSGAAEGPRAWWSRGSGAAEGPRAWWTGGSGAAEGPRAWWTGGGASPAGGEGAYLAALRWPAIAAGVGLAVCGWWLVRNLLVYGPLDPLAMIRHDQVVVGQPRWSSYDLEALDYFARILFRSFWGMFGWMGVVLDDGFYILYLVLTVLGVLGVLFGRWRRGSALTPRPRQGKPLTPQPPLPHAGEGEERPAARANEDARLSAPRARGMRHEDLLLASTLLVLAEVLYYNLTFIQPQGRYLFPAVVPISLFLATGWWRLAQGATGRPVARLVTAGVLAGAIGWGLGEAHGALRASELWTDNALIGAAVVGASVVLVAPRALRARLPDGLCLTLALTLGLLDLAALVKFVAPAFPVR